VRRRRRGRQRGAATIWKVPEELWNRIAILLPIEEFRPPGGRPWTPPRRILDGVHYVLRTGCQCNAVPREYRTGSTLHRRFQRWVELGIWEAIWRRLLGIRSSGIVAARIGSSDCWVRRWPLWWFNRAWVRLSRRATTPLRLRAQPSPCMNPSAVALPEGAVTG